MYKIIKIQWKIMYIKYTDCLDLKKNFNTLDTLNVQNC